MLKAPVTSPNRLSRSLSRKPPIHPFPEPSNETFRLLANPDIPFASICRYVDSDVNPIINEARILESRVYVQRGAPVAPHLSHRTVESC